MTSDKIREGVSELASHPQELRNELQEIVEFQDNGVAGYVQLDESLNLDKCAIGLGLENVEYEPSVFEGLVYRYQSTDGVYATALLFPDGQITVVDAPSETTAEMVVIDTVERLRELELFDGLIPSEEDIQLSESEYPLSGSVDGLAGSGCSESETENTGTKTEMRRDEQVECYKCGAEILVEDAVLQASNETEEYWQCFGECER